MYRLYEKYYGIVHETDEVQQFNIQPTTLEDLTRIVTNLNKQSHIYGITYYVEVN